MPHFIRYCAPGAGDDAAARLERALTRAGRTVLERRPLPAGEPHPPPEPGTLRWQVRRLPADPVFDEDFNVLNAEDPDPAFLYVEETLPEDARPGPDGWDLTLCRELSAEADAFVCALDDWEYVCRQGVAVFLAGRSIDVRERTAGDVLDLGGPPPQGDRWLPVWSLHGRHAEALLGESHYWLSGVVAHAEEWRVTPAGPFRPESRSPTCRVVLPGVADVPGMRARSVRVESVPFAVLAHEGRLADLDLAALSAGPGRPLSWGWRFRARASRSPGSTPGVGR
ncbi:hypothetical protein [Thermomonospora cellulosilytica]|uniref:Uncharacterized protein n=1 Tax=Thermomonospora cellulosilytica TaxID=1411118 RepID=A0A7W3MZN2_9ACTN|nr:hypothetical protein [Thermomonospora cellulosilytica]MBA9004762.1 hypothetical protein [Thermomonospora cellulosilytica]